MAQNAPPPRPFGDYDRYEVLGRGGFGVVYRARHRVLDRIVALKLLDPSATADPGFADRFRREAATAARLDHPNIVTIHNVGEVSGRLYIDMRYVPGETLSALISREAPMPLDRTIAILRQVADALDHAHAELVVHRDVKPANVLVEANGRASLADFGLARPAANSQAGATNTLPNIAGTLPYMAPEQFDDEVPGPPADRYALGVVAYQMLAGVLPFPGPTVGRLIRQVMGTPAPSLRGVRPDLPLAIDDAIQKMLAKEPTDRFSRARMLVDALESAIPKGLVVDASGGGTHRSVIEAVAAAPPGARIVVRPGTYAGPVVLSGTIGLVAEGPRDQVIIEGTGTCAVEVTGGRPKVSSLTLRVVEAGTGSVPALRISGGRPTIMNCNASSTMGHGIDVVGARANPSVTACVVHDCKEYGIWVREKARGTFERCEVDGDSSFGIAVSDRSDPVVRDCAFRVGGGLSGIMVHSQGKGTFERCEVDGGSFFGIVVRDRSDPVVRDCVFRVEATGISVGSQGKGTFERCEVAGNANAGITVSDGGDPVVRECTFRDGLPAGIFVHTQGKGTFERCEVVSNALAGIEVREGGDPVVRECTFRDGKASGILVHTQGKGTFERCEVVGNAYAGIEVRDGGDPAVRDCTFRANRNHGVIVRADALGTFRQCRLEGNTPADWLVEGGAGGTRRGNHPDAPR